MAAISDEVSAANPHRLHLAFADPKAFEVEYARNLARGGALIASTAALEMREIVEVVLEIPFANATHLLRAEVVHAGGGSVAVEFLDPTPELRELLEPLRAQAERLTAAAPKATQKPVAEPAAEDDEFLIGVDEEDLVLGLEGEAFDLDDAKSTASPQGFESNSQPHGQEGQAPSALSGPADPNDRTYRARAERATARVTAAVRGPTGKSLPARTRDLSNTGMLLSVEGEELPIGRQIEVSMRHPISGEQLTVPAKVVRHLEANGVVGAVAVELTPSAQGKQMERFVADVKQVDAQQRRAGICGPLEELGGASLLQMFAALSKRGTLTVSHGVEEGVVVFDEGCMRLAQVGSVTGIKALARMLSWRDGFFEFRAHVDPIESKESGIPMEGAILEAIRTLDEATRLSGPQLPPAAKLEVARAQLAVSGPMLGKTEQAVLELATAGFTIRRILDVIPENDAVIRSAITALVDRGLVRLA